MPAVAPLDETLTVAPGKKNFVSVWDVGKVDSLPALRANASRLLLMAATYTLPFQYAGDMKMPLVTPDVLGNTETDWTIWLSLPLWKWPMLSRSIKYRYPGFPDARSSCTVVPDWSGRTMGF